jgi:hypothetical protein
MKKTINEMSSLLKSIRSKLKSYVKIHSEKKSSRKLELDASAKSHLDYSLHCGKIVIADHQKSIYDLKSRLSKYPREKKALAVFLSNNINLEKFKLQELVDQQTTTKRLLGTLSGYLDSGEKACFIPFDQRLVSEKKVIIKESMKYIKVLKLEHNNVLTEIYNS